MKNIVFLSLLCLIVSACGKAKSRINTSTSASLESLAPDVPNGDMVPVLTPEESAELLEDFIPQVDPTGRDNRYSTALFAIAREMIVVKETVKFTEVEISTPYLKDGPLKIQLHKSANEVAPLAIIMNPLFSGDFQDQMLRFKEFYAKKGYHVLVFPNTWSPEYLNHNPSFFPGDIWTEAKMHLELFDQLIDGKIGRGRVRGVTLIGLSYGAFLGGVVKAYDQRRSRPLIDGPTLLLNPPHDIVHSLRTIDRQVTEVGLIDGAKCLLNGGLAAIVAAAFKVGDYNEAKLNEACAKYLLTTVGFDLILKYSIASLNFSKKLGLSAKEIAAVTFENYIHKIAKLKPSPSDSDLGYWLSEARKNGYGKILVVNSKDDSINEGNDLKINPYFKFTAQTLLSMPTGGHTGLREAKSAKPGCGPEWIACLLMTIYP